MPKRPYLTPTSVDEHLRHTASPSAPEAKSTPDQLREVTRERCPARDRSFSLQANPSQTLSLENREHEGTSEERAPLSPHPTIP